MANNKTFFVNKIFSLACLMILVLVLSNISVMSFLLLTFKNRKKEDVHSSRIVELWNVDAFDAGYYGKTIFLEKIASRLFIKNTGLCVIVKNMSYEACVYNLQNGVYPDMISYSHDLKENIKPLLRPMILHQEVVANNKSVYEADGHVLAVSWCAGAYFTFGNKVYLEKINVHDNLLASVSKCGFNKKTKNKMVPIFSCVCGVNGIENYDRLINFGGGDVSNVVKKQSGYDAYTDFMGGASTLLIGTQRDLLRILAKQDYATNYIFEFESVYSNLFQYISVLSDNTENIEDCTLYINYLLSSEGQSMMDKFGMFSPIGCTTYDNLQWIELQKKFNGIANLEVF